MSIRPSRKTIPATQPLPRRVPAMPPAPGPPLGKKPPRQKPQDSFQVAVECASEEQQREVYTRLIGEGFRCRVLTM